MNRLFVKALIDTGHFGRIVHLLKQNINIWSVDDIQYLYDKSDYIKSITLYIEKHFIKSIIDQQDKLRPFPMKNGLQKTRIDVMEYLFDEKTFIIGKPNTIKYVNNVSDDDVKMYHMSDIVLKLYPNDISYKLYDLVTCRNKSLTLIKYITSDVMNNMFHKKNAFMTRIVIHNIYNVVYDASHRSIFDWYGFTVYMLSDHMLLRYKALHEANYATVVLNNALTRGNYNIVKYIIDNRNHHRFERITVNIKSFLYTCQYSELSLIKIFIDNDLHDIFRQYNNKTLTRKMYIWKCFVESCKYNRKDTVEYMLNTDLPDRALWCGNLSALTDACVNNAVDVVELLLSKDRIDTYPQSTLTTIIKRCVLIAFKCKYVDILKILLSKHVQRNISNSHMSQYINSREIKRYMNTIMVNYLKSDDIRDRFDIDYTQFHIH